MSPPDRADDRLAIERLNHAFCHALDRGAPEAFAALFTADAVYTSGPRRSEGREGVLAFAHGRIADGPRTSRHCPFGLNVVFEDAALARGTSTCMAFSAAGRPPIASTLPTLVADFHDLYRCEEGRWLFAERHIVPIFTRTP